MSRKIKLSASSLNIRIHPHSPELYEKWIKAVYRLNRDIQLRGDKYGIISSINDEAYKNEAIIGIITTFTKIDKDGHWFNVNELKEATDEEIAKIELPSHLFPNSSSFSFYFDLSTHRLYFQTYSDGKSLSARFAYKLFERLANIVITKSEFKLANISIIQDKKTIEKMFSIPVLKTATFLIEKPNSDLWDGDFEENVEQHLSDTGSKSLEIGYKSESRGTIKPTDDMRLLAKIASENGKVEITGRDESGGVNFSSDNFPEVIQTKYDPDQTTQLSAFYNMVREKLKRRIN